MKKEWSFSNDKALLNFSVNYCTSIEEILDSQGFRSVVTKFLEKNSKTHTRNNRIMRKYFPDQTAKERFDQLQRIWRLLVTMTSKDIARDFPQYAFIHENRKDFLHIVESIYRYWRNIERYCLITEKGSQTGLANSSFIDAKEAFDALVLRFYRRISYNLTEVQPQVYRQVPAGTNAGMVCKDYIWPIPADYAQLEGIPFIKNVVLEAPFIAYPKRNKRDGFFTEIEENPVKFIGINADHFFCYPAKVGNLLAFIYVHRDFLTHGISCANLFELATEGEASGRKPDILYVMGASNPDGEPMHVFYDDEENNIMVGYVSNHVRYDYFGYMKKMVLTLHNLAQIKRGNLPIHGAMVEITLKDGHEANVVIIGDSGAGKSESIEAFRSLASEYISDMTVIFDDMGTFVYNKEDHTISAYGTEIGAFVRLDDLDTGYAFKELDRSIFMNPDKTNARLINPVASYDEIIQGLPVDVLLYANNFDNLADEDPAIVRIEDVDQAIEVFRDGKRMAKGTTTEEGITTSYFANPFGPHQKQEECDVLLPDYFKTLYDKGTFVGEIKTQLGIANKERTGPEKASIELFALIRELETHHKQEA